MSDRTKSTFYFRAGTPEGEVFSGQLHASTADDALLQLRQKGFSPLRLEAKPIQDSWLQKEISLTASRRLAMRDCETFCREFALLLGAGIPAAEALGLMQPSLKRNSPLARFTSSLRQGLRLGKSLSGAISDSGFVVPTDLVPVIRAGEEAGSLATSLTMRRTSASRDALA